jgi:predicted nuclease of predicted toxin-antitoxin system
VKILVDENIPQMTVQALRESGHDVRDLRGTVDEGLDDRTLWIWACKEKRLLITTDKGFSHYRDPYHPGVLIVRLRRPNRMRIHERVLQGITQIKEDEWLGKAVTMRDSVCSVWRQPQTSMDVSNPSNNH